MVVMNKAQDYEKMDSMFYPKKFPQQTHFSNANIHKILLRPLPTKRQTNDGEKALESTNTIYFPLDMYMYVVL